MKLHRRIKRALLRRLLPIPVQARHAEYSVVSSADDDPAAPSPRLVSTALQAVTLAQHTSLEGIQSGRQRQIAQLEIWPGEHYKLLTGLVKVVDPQSVIEVGTGGGAGALCIKQALSNRGKLTTFDIDSWKVHTDNVLLEVDFQDGRLIQHVGDLTQPPVFQKHRPLFEGADFIFIDAAKDGVMEQSLLDLLETVSFKKPPLLVFDDIRVWNMLRIWRGIRRPKLDLTSFGHWTGTGLVDWSGA